MTEKSDIRLERAVAASAGRIAALQAAVFPQPWGEPFVASLMHLPGTIAYIAVEDGAALGFVLARAIAGEAEILSIAVVEGRRGRGLGAALLQQALAAALAAGAGDIHLEVNVANAAAIALYERAGFERSGVRARYYSDGSDALVLRRRLIRG